MVIGIRRYVYMVRNWKELNISTAVANSKSYSETLRYLDIRVNSGNIQHLKCWIVKLNIDTSHFNPFGFGNGGNVSNKFELSEILINGSNYIPSRLKRRLVSAGILEYKCSECGMHEWRGKPISLQLDHINGNRQDNRIENIRILCPNCHSQTDTFCIKNKKGKAKEWKCDLCGGKVSKGRNRCRDCWLIDIRK